jgi:hypothetical protein
MVTKDFSFQYKTWGDGEPYLEMYSDVIIKRHGKLWTVKVRTGFDVWDNEKFFETALADHMKHCRRTYYLWLVSENEEKALKQVGLSPFEFVDEQMTRQEYSNKFTDEVLY